MHDPRPNRQASARFSRVPMLIPSLTLTSLMVMGPLTGHAAQHPGRSGGHAHTVIIENMSFRPQVLVVHRGDRITWVNRDLFPHTVTSAAGEFDSHEIAPDASWTYVAGKAGEYHYVCTLHVTMRGVLEVR